MITTIRVNAVFSPTRTLTIAGGSSVDFWSMQPQRGTPERTRQPSSAITRQFDKVASITHRGKWLTTGGERIDWRPHGSAFVQIVGGTDDKLWVSATANGVSANITRPAGCPETDCSTAYADGYAAGHTWAEQAWQAWIQQQPMSGGGEEVAGGIGTATNVPAASTSTQLLAANTNRLGFRVQNESNMPLYIKYGSAASVTSYTAKVLPDGWLAEDGYFGVLHGIWPAGATGNARITEITP